jgi:plastocyanin
MRRRDVFLRIEKVSGYSPLAPVAGSRRYGRDWMRNTGHELGRVQTSEIQATTMDALVYRQYLDSHHEHPVMDPVVAADTTEPSWDRRVPGTVIWAQPGERLYIHVENGDDAECHSLHLHGLHYGIDSDGAWPFGIADGMGRRSDEILPGDSWTYVFDATEDTIGAWPFHDHAHGVQHNINRGLFGGVIVRDPRAPRVDLEIPLFIHQLSTGGAGASFESNTLHTGDSFSFKFDQPGTIAYHCKIHGLSMAGQVIADPAAGPGNKTVDIRDNYFTPASVSIQPGATVTWDNAGSFDHIVISSGGGASTFCLNGRAYTGTSPVIEAAAGQSARWYVFNLDLGSVWHNFHPHSTRWQLPTPAGGASDVHSLSPAESFVADTLVPDAVRLPGWLEELQCDPPPDACRVRVSADFLFHCHLEEHMMSGLAGILRSQQWVWMTDDATKRLNVQLPYDDGDDTPWVDVLRCQPSQPHGRPVDHGQAPRMKGMNMPAMGPATSAGGPSMGMPPMAMPALGVSPIDMTEAAQKGMWEILPCDSQALAVHAVLMHTGKVLFFAGSGNYIPRHTAHDMRGVVWDYEAGTFHTPETPYDVFCAGQTTLADGKVLISGGTEQYDPFIGLRSAWLFDPIIEEWIRVGSMARGRWYPTLLTLGDGSVLATVGTGGEFERFTTVDGWADTGPSRNWPLYSHLILLEDGRILRTGGHLGGESIDGLIFDPASAAETVVPGLRAQDHRDEAFSVLLPPAQDQRVMVLGGGGPGIATDLVDIVDLTAASPAYTPGPSLNHARGLHNAVLLPDRTVFVSGGGLRGETRADAVHQSEIYDPTANVFHEAATASVSRLYHSIALLLPDGRVITAGSNPDRGDDELRLELFHPPYLFRGARPIITDAPESLSYGEHFAIHTPHANRIKWAQLIRPMAVTHSCDTSQRLVALDVEHEGGCHLHTCAPDNCNLAPPGWYLLFLTDEDGIPSTGSWVRLDHEPTPPGPAPDQRIVHTAPGHSHMHDLGPDPMPMPMPVPG